MGDTWLQLPVQMGGTRFGPFQSGLVQIGTDRGQCQIVLAPQMGIAPVHVTVALQGPGAYVVQPVQRGFGLFLQKSGGNLFPIAAAVQAAAGDTLILGSPAGPRFTLQYEETPRAVGGGRPARGAAAGGAGGIAGAVGRELMRQQRARWMMRNPLYREITNLQYRMRSGALTNPRVLVGLIVGGIGLVLTLGATCLGALGVVARSLFG